MTAHNLLLHERSRQEQAKQLRFRKLFHIGRPVTVLSVALLAATAVIGSTINTMSYLDSISAAQPVPTTHRVTARRSANTQTLVLGSSVSSDLSGQVLGTSVIAPAPSTEAQINVAAMTSTVASLVNNLLNQYLSQGLLTGPAGPPGPSGLTPGFSGPNGMVQNGNGQTTSVIGGTPIVSYIPASQGNGNYTGGSLAGFTNLSAGTFASGNTTISGNLNVSGPVSASSLTSSGDATIAGALSAATSTLSTLTVSGPATFNGSTTIAGLTVIGLNPGLTQGSIAIQGTSGLSQDNANLFYDATNHHLGLGTTTPSQLLTVAGNAVFTGNVGIGTTSPSATLQVYGSGTTNPFLVSSSSGTSLMVINNQGNLGIGTTSIGSRLSIQGSDSTSANSGLNVMNSAGTSGLIVLNNGNVGIGTTAPASLLSVGTNNQFQISSAGVVTSGVWNGTAIPVANGGTGAITATSATANLQFLQSGTGAVARSVTNKLTDTVSVKDFGAKGDGVTDDTVAFQAAFDSLPAGGVVFVPLSTGSYKVGLLTLTTKTGWTTLKIQGNLILTSPLSLPTDYAVIGESGSAGTQFSTSPSAHISGSGLGANGVIKVIGRQHVTIENITISPLTTTNIGIYIQDSNDIRLNNVNAIFYEGTLSGSGIVIRDSWGIYIHGGHISASTTNSDPSILVTGTGTLGSTGNYTSYGIYIQEMTLAHRGIRFRRDAGAGSVGPWMQPIVVEDVLYESGYESPITFDTSSGAAIVGVTLNRIWPADSAAVFPLITVIGNQVYEVAVNFPVQSGGTIVGGGTIHGLYVSSATAIAYSSVGQTGEFQITVDGKTGIGTSSPKSALDVSGAVAIGTYAGSAISAANGLAVSGNVGIGTTGPVANLHVVNGGSDALVARIEGNAGGAALDRIDFINVSGIGNHMVLVGQRIAGGTGANGAAIDMRDTFSNGNYTGINIGTADINFTTPDVSVGTNRMVIKGTSGNVGIGTTTPTLGPLTMSSGAYVSAGGVWTNASDRNLKENFATISPASILEKIDQLPVTEWNYKTEGPGVNHIGPVAQDFYAAFSLGGSDTSISTIDPAGVALLGIQALDQKLEALQGSLTGNATTTGELTVYNPGNFSGDSVGEAKILSGQTSVRITFTQPYAYQPIVTATPVGDSALADGFRFTLEDIDASGFTIQTLLPVTSDTTFDWHSFASPAARLTVSDGSTAPIALIVPPAAPSAPPIITDPATAGDPSSTPDSTASTTPASAAGSSTPPAVLGASTSTPPVAPSPSAPLTAPPPPPPSPATSQSSSPAPAPSTPSDAAMSPAD